MEMRDPAILPLLLAPCCIDRRLLRQLSYVSDHGTWRRGSRTVARPAHRARRRSRGAGRRGRGVPSLGGHHSTSTRRARCDREHAGCHSKQERYRQPTRRRSSGLVRSWLASISTPVASSTSWRETGVADGRRTTAAQPCCQRLTLTPKGTTAKAALWSTVSGSVPACASAARAHEPSWRRMAHSRTCIFANSPRPALARLLLRWFA